MGQAELTLELLALPAAPSHPHAARGPCAAAGRPLSLTSAPRAATAAATRASALRARVLARGGVCRECECAAARRCVCLAVCACTRLSVLSSSPVLARWSPVRAFLFSGKLFAEDQSPSQAQSTGLWSRRRPRASGSPGRTQQWSPRQPLRPSVWPVCCFLVCPASGAAGTAGFLLGALRACGLHSVGGGLSLWDFRLERAFSAVSGGECAVRQPLRLLLEGCVAGCLRPSGLRPWRGACWGHLGRQSGVLPPARLLWGTPLCRNRLPWYPRPGESTPPAAGLIPAVALPLPWERVPGGRVLVPTGPLICVARCVTAGDASRRRTSCGLFWDAGLGLSPQPMLDMHLVPCGHQAAGMCGRSPSSVLSRSQSSCCLSVCLSSAPRPATVLSSR